MKRFTVIWAGQFVSLTASAMTIFALTVWLWQETGQATTVALQGFFSFAPGLLLGVLAGVVADRFNRKWVMLAADGAAGLGTLGVLLLLEGGTLQVWHLYVLGAWSGAAGTFQVPAFAAAVASLVPKAQFARANAMRSFASSGAQVAAPALAGLLLALTGLKTILLLDLLALGVAALALLTVRIPSHGQKGGTLSSAGALAGFSFLKRQPALFQLTLAFTSLQFFGMLGVTVLAPLILTRTGGDEAVYGLVSAAIGAGGVAGALFMSIRGGRGHETRTIGLGIAAGSAGLAALGLASSPPGWMLAAAGAFFFFPLVGAASGAVKQRKVPPPLQGRVFAADQLLQTAGIACGILSAGPLADRVFEPAFLSGARWLPAAAGSAPPGTGMAFMLVLAGVCGVLTGVAVLASPAIRTIERTVPDHDGPASR